MEGVDSASEEVWHEDWGVSEPNEDTSIPAEDVAEEVTVGGVLGSTIDGVVVTGEGCSAFALAMAVWRMAASSRFWVRTSLSCFHSSGDSFLNVVTPVLQAR